MLPSLRPVDADRPYLRRLAMAVVTVAAIAFLYQARDLLLLAFGAMLGAVLFSTVADVIAARSPLPRAAGLAIAIVGFLATVGLMGWLFGEEIAAQATQLRRTLPGDWARIRNALDGDPLGHLLLGSLRNGTGGSGIAARIVRYGWGSIELAANFLIIVVGAIFFSAQPTLYRDGIVRMTPRAHRDLMRAALDDIGRALRLWLLTQLASMVLMGAMIGVGLWWSGIQAPVALGLLGGLGEFIPYVGPTLAMVPAIIVAVAGSGSLTGVLVTYLIVRIVQANLITPLITHRLVSVPPGLYLFLILSAGFAFGTFGLFFSGALAVTGYTLAIRLYMRETLGEDVAPPGLG